MDSGLLVTKLQTPVTRSKWVPRVSLLSRLAEARMENHRLILTAAPAGFGKTSVIVEWLTSLRSPSMWVTLDEGDNDLTAFFSLLTAALQRLQPGIGTTVSQLIHLPQLSSIQSLCIAFLNEIATAQIELVLILDDYHLITNPAIHQAVAFMIERQPLSMQTVMITRETPPLPIARLRARNQLTEIDGSDLRFSYDEAAQFFLNTLQLSLPPADVQALHTRTEGWVTGLQLAAFAMRQSAKSPQDFIETFTGRNRYIGDYLAAEVIDRLLPDDKAFLRQTSILDALNVSLCNAVAQIDHSQTILARLEAAHVFLTPLDDHGGWYRYHRMFAELLRSTLTPDENHSLHARASRWYETQGNTHQAVHHAFAANALDDAARLIASSAEKLFVAGEIVTLNRWTRALPDSVIGANLRLVVFRGLSAVLNGDALIAEESASTAESLIQVQSSNNADWRIDRIAYMLMCAYLALSHQHYDQVILLTTDMLSLLSEPDRAWRLMALWLLAEAHERAGDIKTSAATLREARLISDETSIYSIMVNSFLASALNELGQRREAVQICESAIRQVENRGALAALLYSRMTQLTLEGNELDSARANFDKLAEPLELLAYDQLNSFVLGMQARLLILEGSYQAGMERLQAAVALVRDVNLSDDGWIHAEIVNLKLKMGDLTYAAEWIDKTRWDQITVPIFLEMEEYLAYARCLIALGHYDSARQWLTTLEAAADRMNLFRRRLTIYLLQALTAEHMGDRTLARSKLLSAVQCAANEGYIYAFLDEDEMLLTLLPGLRSTAPAFIDAVLNAARDTDQRQSLDEPLSDRELEVLRLITAGLSNAEIADRLVIAESTVKRHIHHIFGKLSVTRRSQAILRAQELALL